MKTLFDLRKDISILTEESVKTLKIPHGDIHIPRYLMPQISSADIPEFLNFLKMKNIPVKNIGKPVSSLKTAQCEFDLSKIKKFMDHPPKAKPYLVSADGYILDGNHSAIAQMNKDPKCSVDCYEIGQPIKKLINTSKGFKNTFFKTVSEENDDVVDGALGEEDEKKKSSKKGEDVTIDPDLTQELIQPSYKRKQMQTANITFRR